MFSLEPYCNARDERKRVRARCKLRTIETDWKIELDKDRLEQATVLNRPAFDDYWRKSELRGRDDERNPSANAETVSEPIYEPRVHSHSDIARRILNHREEFQIEVQSAWCCRCSPITTSSSKSTACVMIPIKTAAASGTMKAGKKKL